MYSVGSRGRKFLLLQAIVVIPIALMYVYLIVLDGKQSSVLSSLHDWNYGDSNVDDQLMASLATIRSPRIAHTILSDEFGMAHYLSLRSMMRFVQPYVMYIHVSNLSTSISEPYLTDLYKQYKNIEMVEYPLGTNDFSTLDAIRTQIKEGIYLRFGLLLRPSIESLLRENECLVDCEFGIILVNPRCPYYYRSDLSGNWMRCLVSDDPENITASALAIPRDLYNEIATYLYVPSMEIEAGQLGPWHKLLWQAYCDCEQLEPTRHPHPVIPWIVHYVWFTDSTWNMTFMQLVGALSNLKINKVRRIIIHSSVPPTGPYWEWLQQRYADRIIRLFHPEPKFVYGKQINPSWREHRADVARLTILQRFGGMYFDWDAIVLKSHEEFRCYDAVMGMDISWIGLANGAIMFTRNSEFLKNYFNNYINYNEQSWGETSILAPMQLYLKTPYLVRVPQHFMDSRTGDYLMRLYTETTAYNTSAFYSFHPCSPEPEKYFNVKFTFDIVAAMNCSLGSMLRHVINYPD